VLSAEVAAQMNDLLAGVVQRGTGRAAALDRPAAGKTGTTQDYRDALFIGYTPDLVTGVWFGNDDNSPMNKVTGGQLPARAWKGFMTTALKGMPARQLPDAPAPSWIDRIIGGLTGKEAPPAQRPPAGVPTARAPAPAPAHSRDIWQSGPIRRDGEM
jgi:penicillin-binding protein 1A